MNHLLFLAGKGDWSMAIRWGIQVRSQGCSEGRNGYGREGEAKV